MAPHTTFGIGGKADLFARPGSLSGLASLLSFAKEESLPICVIGGGANILVSDLGIRGLTIDMTALNRISSEGNTVTACAGASMNHVAEFALDRGLTGMEFVYGMPGTVGGSVWMNARCYGVSMSDRVSSVKTMDMTGTMRTEKIRRELFDYKRSPYQGADAIILEASFELHPGDRGAVREEMERNLRDRREKGHFTAPCAGSVFKNCRDFGEPTGKIIDSLGLRGFRIGGAQVAPYHANIFINTGTATAKEMRDLVLHVQEVVRIKRGFLLEPEILFVGQWEGQ